MKETPDKKLSIIDVAKLAGVSTATVSRVLNGNGGYSKKTEEKVLRTVKECGFTPNGNAVSLRTNRSHCIGVIVPDITNEFFAKIIHELDIFFLEHHYSLLICDSNEDYELEDMYIHNLIQKNVDGIIYISGQDEIKNISSVETIPIVYIDRCPKNAKVLIQSDNEEGGYLATRELLESGCRNILLMRDLRYASTIRQRKAGYLRALEEAGVPYNGKLEIGIFPDYEDAKIMMERVLKVMGCYFDGIFATNDRIALACIQVLMQHGYRVPEDVKVVGFDNVSLTEFCNPSITTITQDTRSIALAAGKSVLDLINHKKIKEKMTVIPVALERRRSTETV